MPPIDSNTDIHSPPALPDGVPEPRQASTDYLIGVHYFPGWKQGTHQGWEKIEPYPDRKPLLGFYDEGNPDVADWEIKWCLEHGIQYFIYCWYRRKENAGHPLTIDDARLGHAIHEGLLNAKYRDRFQFAIMWENYGERGKIASLDDLKNNLFPFWAEHYFSKPNYLTLDGMPVLCIYHLDSLIEQTGGPDGARKAIEIMRDGIRDAGHKDFVVMCEHRNTNKAFFEKVRDAGADSVFAYCWHPPQKRPTIEQAFQQQFDKLQAWQDMDVLPWIPTASVGWDPWAWRKTPEESPNSPWLHPDNMTRWYSSPDQFRQLLVRMKAFMDALPDGHMGRRMLMLDNWNEWGEGHYIAPHAGAGFGYLQAVREVFTERNNLPDYRTPEQLGLGPYNARYRESKVDTPSP